MIGDKIAISHPFPGFVFCTPLDIPSHFYAFWIPILSFETLLCSLALLRGYKSYRDHEIRRIGRLRRRRPSVSRDPNPTPSGGELNILEILLRDSVFYFIVCVNCSLRDTNELIVFLNFLFSSAFATYFTTTMMWIFAPVRIPLHP